MTGVPLIPNLLKDANWKSQRDIVTKLVKGETGIGKALREITLAYDAVQWQYFDPHVGGPLPKPRTLEELQERKDALKDKNAQLTNLKGKVATARALCKQFGDKWERSKVVPDATRIYVQHSMVTACDNFTHALDTIGEDGYTLVRAEIVHVQSIAAGLLKSWVRDVGAGIKQVEADPTVGTYDKELHQHVRGVGTTLSKLTAYKALYHESWEHMADDSFMHGVHDGAEVKAKVALVKTALKKVKAAMPAD